MRLTRSLVPALVAAAGLAAPLAIAPTAQAAAVTCAGLKATIVGNDKGNTITGTPKRDVIAARGGNDTIRGLGGNDVICGGEGADTIVGGEGDDRLYGESDLLRIDQFGRVVKRGDTISGGLGNDVIDLGYDPRPATEGTVAELDGVSYFDAPRPSSWTSAPSRTVPIAAEGNDTVTGYDGGIRVIGSPAQRHHQGHQLARRHRRPRWRRHRSSAAVATTPIVGRRARHRRQRPALRRGGRRRLAGTVGIDTVRRRQRQRRPCGSTSESHQVFRGGSGIDTSPSRSRSSPASSPRATAARTSCASLRQLQPRAQADPAHRPAEEDDDPRPPALHARGQDHRLQRHHPAGAHARRSSRAATTPRSSPPTPTTA